MGDTVEEGTGVNENHTTEMNNSTMHPHIYIYIDIHISIYIYDIFTYKKHESVTCTNIVCYYVKMT